MAKTPAACLTNESALSGGIAGKSGNSRGGFGSGAISNASRTACLSFSSVICQTKALPSRLVIGTDSNL